MTDLRAIRKGSGLTLVEAAAEAGLDKGHLSRVERGQENLSLDAFRRVAWVLNLTRSEVYDFVCGSRPSEP